MTPLLFAMLLGGAVYADSSATYSFSPNEIVAIQQLNATITQDSKILFHKILLDPLTKEITFEGKFNIVDDTLEVLITSPSGRVHESPIHTEISPQHFETLLWLSGVQKDSLFTIELKDARGGRQPIENLIRKIDQRYGHEPQRFWQFTGSGFERNNHLATREGNLALLWNEGNTVIKNPEKDGDVGNNFTGAADFFPPKKYRDSKVFIYIKPVLNPGAFNEI